MKKILIAEDIDSINQGIASIFKKNANLEIHHAKYCDDAFLKIKKAIIDGVPFDLLITDLSFKPDHRTVILQSGEELIKAVKSEQSAIKIIVYSIEDRSFRIKTLFNEGIDAYVCKGRQGSVDLLNAVKAVTANERYISPELSHLIVNPAMLEIDDTDIDLLRLLAQGFTQDEIGKKFKEMGKSSSSLSSVEKRMNKLKIYFKAKNAVHLVGIVKDMGVV
ncbi:response regulator [Flavobacterium sp. NST-5]|uniref:Response regulator n=1 Tax=Flavobacterium ichthyis TaxID=2698827 RepID=A0ABW9Z5A3_9FLAO|nr:response regulator transcription factor [Flavobacterium ichthyis]NBL63864.1 response regulator [Flavobacterium ichthyis]